MTLYTLCLLANTFVVFSQGSPDSPDGDGDPILDPAPIDDFIWILIVAGLLVGIYVLLKGSTLARKTG